MKTLTTTEITITADELKSILKVYLGGQNPDLDRMEYFEMTITAGGPIIISFRKES